MHAPVTLSGPSRLLLMTDDEFLAFCSRHEDLRIESNAKGEIELMAPVGTATGTRNARVSGQLSYWTEQDGRCREFDSSTMFVLPNGARRSPDASWIDNARIARIPESRMEGFWHICPDFVVEIRSQSDSLSQLHERMLEWMANGACLGWLVDAPLRAVTIYRPDQELEVLAAPALVRGEGPVAGFVLDMKRIWALG